MFLIQLESLFYADDYSHDEPIFFVLTFKLYTSDLLHILRLRFYQLVNVCVRNVSICLFEDTVVEIRTGGFLDVFFQSDQEEDVLGAEGLLSQGFNQLFSYFLAFILAFLTFLLFLVIRDGFFNE